MRWVEPQYSKSQVEKQGKKLIKSDITEEEYSYAMDVLNNWRASHAYPLNYFQSWLREEVKKIDKNALVGQRLKRTPSIVNKLKRSSIKLTQIQDIGGCRAIVKDVKSVYLLENNLSKTTRSNSLNKENDYIKKPRSSGYRGIHLIYDYEINPNYQDRKIEIQLRSAIQHYWATSVEIAGTFTQQNLKNSEGEKKWLEFFQYASILLSYLENCLPHIEEEKLIKAAQRTEKLLEELNIIDILTAFTLSIKEDLAQEADKKGRYFLLILNSKEQTIEGHRYTPNKFSNATEDYKRLEKEYKDNPYVNVVLVQSDSIKKLKKEYPNYFADSRAFLDCLKRGIKRLS